MMHYTPLKLLSREAAEETLMLVSASIDVVEAPFATTQCQGEAGGADLRTSKDTAACDATETSNLTPKRGAMDANVTKAAMENIRVVSIHVDPRLKLTTCPSCTSFTMDILQASRTLAFLSTYIMLEARLMGSFMFLESHMTVSSDQRICSTSDSRSKSRLSAWRGKGLGYQ
jgi:hypothetical protein